MTPYVFAALFVGALGGWTLSRVHWRRFLKRSTPDQSVSVPSGEGAAAVNVDAEAPSSAPMSPMDEVFTIAASLDDFYKQSAYPRDLLKNEEFRRGVDLIGNPEQTSQTLLDYMVGANVITACMALEALSRRRDDTPFKEAILANFTQISLWSAYFALRVLAVRWEEPVVGAVLTHLDDDWVNPLPINILREFIALRRLRGETPAFGDELNSLTDPQSAIVKAVLEKLRKDVPDGLSEELKRWRDARIDMTLLSLDWSSAPTRRREQTTRGIRAHR